MYDAESIRAFLAQEHPSISPRNLDELMKRAENYGERLGELFSRGEITAAELMERSYAYTLLLRKKYLENPS